MVSKNYKPDVLGLPKKPAAALMRCRSVSTHPPYEEMIMTAIRTLKERTGSSLYVIGKLIEKKYKDLLPSNFRKLLLFRLKKLVSGEKLVRVKNSFKLPPKRLRPSKATATALALALASDGAGAGAGAGAGVVAGAGKPAAANGNPKAKPQPKKQPSHALRMNPFPLPQPKAAKAQGLQPAKAKQAAC